MAHDLKRAYVAETLLLDRDARYAIFPSDIFDEYAWNMLLHLFVAMVCERTMSEANLISLVHTNINIGQRWLYLLAKDGQIENRMAGDDVMLTQAARTKLRRYLDGVGQHQ